MPILAFIPVLSARYSRYGCTIVDDSLLFACSTDDIDPFDDGFLPIRRVAIRQKGVGRLQ
jgi:hypothetical protein